MSELRIDVDERGLNAVIKQLAPQQASEVMIRWYDRAIKFVVAELRARAPARLKGKVRHMTDGLIPPRWARVFVKSPLAHLLEGGTGRLGVAPFNHASQQFPAIDGEWGLMKAMGISRPQAFVIARSIAMRGGNPPRPFIGPTAQAVKTRVERMAEQIADEVLNK